GLEPAHRWLRRAVEEGYEAIAVDAVVERLSHPYVFEGRVSGAHIVQPRPDVRIGIGDGGKALPPLARECRRVAAPRSNRLGQSAAPQAGCWPPESATAGSPPRSPCALGPSSRRSG